jgi:regulation of enolase protein 1 (concanavalin A-like superfamily)
VITNTGTAPLTVFSATVGGTNTGDWPGLTGTCTQAVPAGGTCSVDVTFRPAASGTRTGAIVLATNASPSPTSIPLRGTGAAPAAGSLPSPWISRDIGTIGAAGSASHANGVFTVQGGGADVWGTADAFQFVYRTLSGDGSLVVRVAAVESVNAWTKAGVMIRSDTTPGAANAALFVTPGKGITFQTRSAAGAVTSSVVTAGTAPRWFRIVRTGSAIAASISADGTTWTSAGQATVALGTSPLVGLAVTSHDASRTAKATLDRVVFTTAPAMSLPSGWMTRDIGAVGRAGSAVQSAGVFTLTGAGDDIWHTADAFRYAYVPLASDGTIVARVAEVQNVNAWTKAGVMIRQTVDPGSAHASMLVTPDKGISFQRRTTGGGASVATTVAGAAPRWVRLTRAGQLFTASVSPDGNAWTTVGSATIAMSGTVWAGLAVSSHDIAATAATRMDHVAVTAAALASGWQSADVGAVPIKGSATSNGTTFSLAGSGADIWGTADAFHFAYRGLSGDGQLVARVATVGNTHRWAKAGVMLRAALTAGAPYAMMLVSASAGSSLQSRSASGGVSKSVSGGAATAAPQWVKIVRTGNVLTGYQSANGTTWTTVGAATIPLSTSAYIGLAVSSHDSTKLAKATFESVR